MQSSMLTCGRPLGLRAPAGSAARRSQPLCTPRAPLMLAPGRSTRLNVSANQIKPPTVDGTSRQYRRTVYDFALWTKHRQVNRYLYNLATMPGSRIIRTLLQPTSVLLAFATLIGLYEQGIESHILPEGLYKFTLSSAEPATLTSFALSLLLVFRTNSSYGRFDEARKIWGGILNRCRAIANQAVTFIPSDDPAGREAVAKWTVGFTRALQAHLQEDANLRAELEKATPKWTTEEIDMLVNAQHRPIKAISVLSELSRQLKVDAFQALQMQENVTFFYDALGGCERLLRTPLPLSYTRHTSRFLTLWLALLPLAMWERFHWMVLPIQFSIALLLLGIDEIGVQIEEPFGILPLDAICNRAQTDINSLVNDDSKVKGYVASYTATDGKQLSGKGPAYPPMIPSYTNGASAPPSAIPAAANGSALAAVAVGAVAAASTSSGNGLGPQAAAEPKSLAATAGWRVPPEEAGMNQILRAPRNPSFENVFGESEAEGRLGSDINGLSNWHS